MEYSSQVPITDIPIKDKTTDEVIFILCLYGLSTVDIIGKSGKALINQGLRNCGLNPGDFTFSLRDAKTNWRRREHAINNQTTTPAAQSPPPATDNDPGKTDSGATNPWFY